MAQVPAGWYVDPTGNHSYRYWDGARWTERVSDGGSTGVDPTELDPELVEVPPPPGSQAPGPPPQQQAQPGVQVTQSSASTGLGTVFGILIGIVLVLVVAIALFYFLSDDGGGGDSTTTTEVVTTTTAPPSG